MARQSNPYGDPVQISRNRDRLIVRYYPTGLITNGNDRKKLPGSWRADVPSEVAECERVAQELRNRLYVHRAAHGLSVGVPEDVKIPLRKAVAAYLASIGDEAATGTLKSHQSRLNVLLLDRFGDCAITDLHLLVGEVLKIADGPRADGRPRAAGTRDGYRGTLAEFGAWLAETHRMPDPFAGKLTQVVNRAERKNKARAKVWRASPFGRTDDEVAISPDEVPSMEQVIALRDAIVRRETSRPPGSKQEGRGSRGGAMPLSEEVAKQLAEAVTCAAATGCRECELLALHTSRIDLATGKIGIDRQLDRYLPWPEGGKPLLVPPKHDQDRTTLVWSSFLPRLKELCEYADKHNNGFLFVPTRRQRHWAKGFETVIERAKDLLEHEHTAWVDNGRIGDEPTRFPFTCHSLRHFFASHSLMPIEAGGLGWSLGLVQQCLGHADARTTQKVYRHVTDLEYLHAINTPHSWPGL